jgi:hypothetical protein
MNPKPNGNSTEPKKGSEALLKYALIKKVGKTSLN